MDDPKLLEVQGLSIIYKTDLETVYAVNNISFSLKKGESEFLSKQIGLAHYDLDQQVYVSVAPEKINVYNAETTRLIKRAH